MAVNPGTLSRLYAIVLTTAPPESLPSLQQMMGDMAIDGVAVEQQVLFLADVLADGLRYGTWPILVKINK